MIPEDSRREEELLTVIPSTIQASTRYILPLVYYLLQILAPPTLHDIAVATESQRAQRIISVLILHL
jgi:hypothetical protein